MLPREVAIELPDEDRPRLSDGGDPSHSKNASLLLGAPDVRSAPLRALLTFASPLDCLYLAIGCLCKAAYGALAVVMLLVIGDVFRSAANLFDTGKTVFWQLALFGLGAFLLESADTWLIEKAKHRQIAEWKKAYVKSILRQDVGWYDINHPQELSSRMGEAIVKIEKGLSVATSNIFMCAGQFVAGCVLGLIKSWDVALVSLAIALCTYMPAMLAQMRTISIKSKLTAEAYGVAGGVASEVLGALRTVSSFGLELPSLKRYDDNLGVAEKVGLGAVLKITFFVATSNSAMYYVLGMGILYSALRLSEDYYDSGFAWSPENFSFCALECNPYDPFQIMPNFTNCSTRSPYALEPLRMSCKVSDDLSVFDTSDGNILLTLLTSIPSMLFANQSRRLEFFEEQFEIHGKADHCQYELAQAARAAPYTPIPSRWCGAVNEKTGWGKGQGKDVYATCGQVYIAFNAVFFGVFGLSQIGLPLKNLVEARVAVADVLKTINRKPSIDSFDDSGQALTSVQGKIDVVDVTFAYPAAPDNLVCKGYSLSIPAGSSCALVGPSGSGKSTIVALLERFYDPSSGAVLLDGVDIRLLNVKDLRRRLGLVGQEPVLFMGTVAENIKIGAGGEATQAEIEEAAKMANAHEFITKALSNGYDTQVGYGGGKLSGGQKQRVAIARAIIKKPSVLLLDEATSALDNTSEKIVQEALDKIMQVAPHTTVTIAHRLTTIKGCNKIAVVKQGRIVEEGTWDELLAIGGGGLFHQLAFKQQQQMNADTDMMMHINEERAESQRLREARQSVSSSGAKPRRSDAGKRSSIGRSGVFASGVLSSFSADQGAAFVADHMMSSSAKASVSVGSPKFGNTTSAARVTNSEAEEATKALPSNASKRLLALTPGDEPLYALGTLCAVATGAIKGLFGLFMIKSISTMQTNDPDAIRKNAIPWALMFVLIGVLNNVVEFIGQNALGRTGEHLTKRLRYELMSILLRQEIGYFDDERNSVGELSEFLGEKVTFVQGIMGEKIGSIAQIQSMLVTCIVVMFVAGSWRVALVVLGFFPIMAAAMALALASIMGGSQSAGKVDETESNEKTAGSVIGEVVTGIRTVASFNAELRFFDDYSTKVLGIRDEAVGRTLKAGITTGLAFALIYVIMGVQLLYGLWLASVGVFGGGDPTAIINGCRDSAPDYIDGVLIPIMVMMQMSLVMNLATDATAANNAALELFERLDRRSLRDPLSNAGEVLPEVKGVIQCKDVHFAYPTRPRFLICKGYNLTIEGGQVCAFAGPSGSGKSTMIALLQRFYDPIAGQVLLDGYDICSLNLAWLRRQFGLVGQEPVLFNGTVAENIGQGKVGGATQDEIEWAAKAANAHDFILNDLGNGYSTQVGLRGGMLSGGQKQRVAIARALVRKPAVMLLDEATSALDNESERVVQAALDEIMTKQKRTTIMIAHRLSTIRKADKIAVISNGVIKEEGTHDELLKIGSTGIYYGLVKASQE
ncbi:hypothetical protein AB1Y20_017390 [Prymnesium parvum]|uniref:Bile salt export pump n=1 Tax=Prymnesium parvum TaxID=97485 RepID=A0AB34JN13_PRYPA